MPELDSRLLIAEAARRFGMSIDDNDPAMVVARLTQVALDHASMELLQNVEHRLKDFEEAVARVQTRAGRCIALEFNERAEALHRELQDDLLVAGRKASDLVEKVNESNTWSVLVVWMSIGILSGLGLFVAGLWVGSHGV